MKKFWLLAAAGLGFIGSVHACTFNWHHHGDTETYQLIKSEIGKHVNDEYCKRFNAKNELIIVSNHYVLSNMVVGHAEVGIRPRNSSYLPLATYSHVLTNTELRTIGDARNLEVEASLSAIDSLMSDLATYKVKW